MTIRFAAVAAGIILVLCSTTQAQTTQPAIPNPILYFTGQESVTDSEGTTSMRYKYAVFNSPSYPAAMFAAAATLPPCGANTRASRTWVDLYDQSGKRLNGFCALRSGNALNTIWFALAEDAVPPSWIYIELTDRQTGKKYRSNLAETTY